MPPTAWTSVHRFANQQALDDRTGFSFNNLRAPARGLPQEGSHHAKRRRADFREGSLPSECRRFRFAILARCFPAAAVALVSFADMSVLSRTFALRGGYDVDGNQELIALGATNVAAGLFQGFPITSSASRTPVAEAAGGKTQITGVVGAVCIALLLLFAPALLKSLPNAALGGCDAGSSRSPSSALSAWLSSA